MKPLAILAHVTACLWASQAAGAQCPGPGKGGPAGEPVIIVLKYYWKAVDVKPAALKTALEKLPTVVKTEFGAPYNTLLVTFKGRCDQISCLETAALAAGVPALVVNHAYVMVGLKTQPGADVKGAAEAIGRAPGVAFAKLTGAGLEMHADLAALNVENLRAAAAAFKCDILVNQTFEYVRYKVAEGPVNGFSAAAGDTKGVMIVRAEGEGVIGLWISRTMVKAGQIERIPGYRIERQ